MIIKVLPKDISSLDQKYKILAQNPSTYECVVEVKTLPEGYAELSDIPEGFEQRCLSPKYGRVLKKEVIDSARRTQKIEEISNWLKNDLDQGIVTSIISPLDGNPIKMNAHYEDATKLDGAVRLAQKLGQTAIDIGDYDDKTQPGISIDDADQISIEMAINYTQKLQKKWNLREQAKTIIIEDLDSLEW